MKLIYTSILVIFSLIFVQAQSQLIHTETKTNRNGAAITVKFYLDIKKANYQYKGRVSTKITSSLPLYEGFDISNFYMPSQISFYVSKNPAKEKATKAPKDRSARGRQSEVLRPKGNSGNTVRKEKKVLRLTNGVYEDYVFTSRVNVDVQISDVYFVPKNYSSQLSQFKNDVSNLKRYKKQMIDLNRKLKNYPDRYNLSKAKTLKADVQTTMKKINYSKFNDPLDLNIVYENFNKLIEKSKNQTETTSGNYLSKKRETPKNNPLTPKPKSSLTPNPVTPPQPKPKQNAYGSSIVSTPPKFEKEQEEFKSLMSKAKRTKIFETKINHLNAAQKICALNGFPISNCNQQLREVYSSAYQKEFQAHYNRALNAYTLKQKTDKYLEAKKYCKEEYVEGCTRKLNILKKEINQEKTKIKKLAYSKLMKEAKMEVSFKSKIKLLNEAEMLCKQYGFSNCTPELDRAYKLAYKKAFDFYYEKAMNTNGLSAESTVYQETKKYCIKKYIPDCEIKINSLDTKIEQDKFEWNKKVYNDLIAKIKNQGSFDEKLSYLKRAKLKCDDYDFPGCGNEINDLYNQIYNNAFDHYYQKAIAERDIGLQLGYHQTAGKYCNRYVINCSARLDDLLFEIRARALELKRQRMNLLITQANSTLDFAQKINRLDSAKVICDEIMTDNCADRIREGYVQGYQEVFTAHYMKCINSTDLEEKRQEYKEAKKYCNEIYLRDCMSRLDTLLTSIGELSEKEEKEEELNELLSKAKWATDPIEKIGKYEEAKEFCENNALDECERIELLIQEAHEKGLDVYMVEISKKTMKVNERLLAIENASILCSNEVYQPSKCKSKFPETIEGFFDEMLSLDSLNIAQKICYDFEGDIDNCQNRIGKRQLRRLMPRKSIEDDFQTGKLQLLEAIEFCRNEVQKDDREYDCGYLENQLRNAYEKEFVNLLKKGMKEEKWLTQALTLCADNYAPENCEFRVAAADESRRKMIFNNLMDKVKFDQITFSKKQAIFNELDNLSMDLSSKERTLLETEKRRAANKEINYWLNKETLSLDEKLTYFDEAKTINENFLPIERSREVEINALKSDFLTAHYRIKQDKLNKVSNSDFVKKMDSYDAVINFCLQYSNAIPGLCNIEALENKKVEFINIEIKRSHENAITAATKAQYSSSEKYLDKAQSIYNGYSLLIENKSILRNLSAELIKKGLSNVEKSIEQAGISADNKYFSYGVRDLRFVEKQRRRGFGLSESNLKKLKKYSRQVYPGAFEAKIDSIEILMDSDYPEKELFNLMIRTFNFEKDNFHYLKEERRQKKRLNQLVTIIIKRRYTELNTAILQKDINQAVGLFNDLGSVSKNMNPEYLQVKNENLNSLAEKIYGLQRNDLLNQISKGNFKLKKEEKRLSDFLSRNSDFFSTQIVEEERREYILLKHIGLSSMALKDSDFDNAFTDMKKAESVFQKLNTHNKDKYKTNLTKLSSLFIKSNKKEIENRLHGENISDSDFIEALNLFNDLKNYYARLDNDAVLNDKEAINTLCRTIYQKQRGFLLSQLAKGNFDLLNKELNFVDFSKKNHNLLLPIDIAEEQKEYNLIKPIEESRHAAQDTLFEKAFYFLQEADTALLLVNQTTKDKYEKNLSVLRSEVTESYLTNVFTEIGEAESEEEKKNLKIQLEAAREKYDLKELDILSFYAKYFPMNVLPSDAEIDFVPETPSVAELSKIDNPDLLVNILEQNANSSKGKALFNNAIANLYSRPLGKSYFRQLGKSIAKIKFAYNPDLRYQNALSGYYLDYDQSMMPGSKKTIKKNIKQFKKGFKKKWKSLKKSHKK